MRSTASPQIPFDPETLDAPELEVMDYDVMEKIGSGRLSTVYLVNCKRGRLRNRQLALRKVSASPSNITKLTDSSSLHLSLSHPSIISLFSTFSTPSAHFQLLELCLGDTLSNYMDGKSLSEDHLRSVLKSLSEALVYLKNEAVVHRNIQPSNVLLTSHGRIKLGDFELATRLPSSSIHADRFMENPHFVAPEILANLPHTYDADLWSIGCIVIACVSGGRPFEASRNHETIDKILNGSYVFPEGMSLDAQDLATRLLEADPKRRIQLPEILSHPFFDGPAMPFTFSISKASKSLLTKHALFESKSGQSNISSSSFPHNHQKHTRHLYAPNRTAIDDNRTQQRTALRGEMARRIVSDPLPSKQREILPSSISLSFRHARYSLGSQDRCQDVSPAGRAAPLTDSAIVAIPIGTTRPVPFTTAPLGPESHKTVHGQITILPSRSLLADFREGERRRGQKGTEVLLIDPQGTKIEIYNAPHLSLPCCLVEPSKYYSIENLPPAYWKQYNDAGLLVERIKQRTPKLILHEGVARCTLMANSPRADVELLFGFHSPNDRKKLADSSPDTSRMRIRLSRQQGSLEIAKHISGTQGEEWTKKVYKAFDEYPHMSAADWNTLDASEKDGMEHLARFWRLCAFLEDELELHSAAHPNGSPGATNTHSRTHHTMGLLTPALTASLSSTQKLPSVNVAPRPPKIPPMARQIDCASLVDKASIEGQHLSLAGKTGLLPTWCKDDSELSRLDQPVSQTKYIPSIGWCIRQSSRITQGGRYKIMFFDGAILEIDADEDWAEFTSQSGVTTRHTIPDCNAKRHIAERMKVFGEFVSMFEE